jgi:hypothetical protein
MRIVTLLAAFALLACGPGRTTFARYPGAADTFDRTAQDPKALEIADRVLTAHGGADKWATAKQLRWSQSITHDGKEVIGGEQAWDRWNGRHHGRARREGGDLIVIRDIYNESNSHALREKEHRQRKIEGGAAEAIATAKERWEFDTAILFMPFLMQEPGAKLEYAGEMPGEGETTLDVLKVAFDPKDSTRTARYHVAVSRESNMIVRIEIQKRGKGENERLGYGLGNWLDAGGMKVPGTAENIGFKGEVATYKDVKVGEPDDSLYIPPPLT